MCEIANILDVYLQNSISNCSEDFDPKYDQNLESLTVKTKYEVTKLQLIELDESIQIIRAFIQTGVQFIDQEVPKIKSIKAYIEAEIIIEYVINKDLELDHVKEHILKNAISHVFLYWKDYVRDQCSRMFLPRVHLSSSVQVVNVNECV